MNLPFCMIMMLSLGAICLSGCASDRNKIFDEAGYIKHTASLEEQRARKLYEEKRLSEVDEQRQTRKAEIDARFLERERGGDGVPVIVLLEVDEFIEKLNLEVGDEIEANVRVVLEEFVAVRTEIIDKYKDEEDKPETADLKTEVQDLVKDLTSDLEESLDGRDMRKLQFVMGSQVVPIKDEIYGDEDELRPGEGIYGKLVDDPEKGSGSAGYGSGMMGGEGMMGAGGMGQMMRGGGGGGRRGGGGGGRR